MSKFTYKETVYKPKCISCGSSNVTMVANTKGHAFRCNKCKKKTRYYGTLDELLRNPGMFKPNPMYNTTVDKSIREAYREEIGQLTDEDLKFLQSLKDARVGSRPNLIWNLVEDRYEPCWEELADGYEIYDPVTKQTLSTVPEPIADIGRLKCIPVKQTTSLLTNSTFINKVEADEYSNTLEDIHVLESLLSPEDSLAKLLSIVSKVNWSKMIN